MENKGVRDFSLRYDILRGQIKYAEARAVGPAAISMDIRRKIKQVFTGDFRCHDAGLSVIFHRIAPFRVSRQSAADSASPRFDKSQTGTDSIIADTILQASATCPGFCAE